MAITKTIEIDVVAPNAQQNINAVTSSLNNASKSSDNLNKTLNTDKGGSKFAGLKDSIGGLVPGFDKASNASSAFNKQLLLLLANPIGLVIAGIVLAVAGLVAIFKTFQPVVDKVEQGLAALSAVATTIKNTFIAVATGTKSLGEAFSSLGSDISDTASRTMDLVKAQQDLDDVLAQQEVQTSRTRAEINKLNVQAKNRALSEAERLKLLEKAGKLEEQDFQQRRKNADEEVRIAREAIAIKAGFSKAEIKLLKEQGLAAKELAESKGGNFDEEFKALANAQKNRIGLEDESTANLEKNQNKRDSLEDARKAKEDAAEVKRKERIEKAKTNAKKEEEDRKANQDALLKELDDLVTFEDEAEKRKEERNKKEEEDRKANQDALLKELDDQITAEENAANKKIEIEQKLADAKVSIQLQGLNALGDLVGLAKSLGEKNKDLQRAALIAESAIGISKIIINTQAANAAARLKYALIPGGAALAATESILNKVSAGIGIAANVAATAKGLAALGGGGAASGGGSNPAGGGGGTSAPQFNIVGQSSTNQLAQTISTQQKQPIKTYVVAGDVTTQQSLDRNAVQTSTFGG
jgi:chemotaxis protein histidine kinase CheA